MSIGCGEGRLQGGAEFIETIVLTCYPTLVNASFSTEKNDAMIVAYCRILFLAFLLTCDASEPKCGLPPVQSSSPEPATSLLQSHGGQRRPIEERIIGGHNSRPANWPFVVKVEDALGLHGPRCSGSLIGRRHVLTASHCINRLNKTHITANVTVTVAVRTAEEMKFEAEEIVFPPKRAIGFEDEEYTDDLAVIKLREAVIISENVYPVCLPDGFRERPGEVGFVAGFGMNMKDVNDGLTLRENVVQFRTFDACDFAVGKNRHDERLICAGSTLRTVGPGDSGGPLMVNRGGTWYQVGVVAAGSLFGFPKLFNRVTRHCDWFAEVTQDDVTCQEVDW